MVKVCSQSVRLSI